MLQVIYNRSNPALSMNFYVNNLQEARYKIRDTGLDINPMMPKLEHALALSKTLAKDFDYVRVDWYIHEEQIWFGELTFTPGAGLVTGLDRGLNKMMGEMWLQDRIVTPQAPVRVADVTDVTLPAMLKKYKRPGAWANRGRIKSEPGSSLFIVQVIRASASAIQAASDS